MGAICEIAMIGSCVGESMMTPGLVPYAATKGAVKMFTQGLSREVGSRGVTVNNVQPGPINTTKVAFPTTLLHTSRFSTCRLSHGILDKA